MTEQIWANQLRFFEETGPRSGVAAGPVFDLQTGPTAAARRVVSWSMRSDAFRQPKPHRAIHEFQEIRQSFTPSASFLAWLIARQASTAGTVTRFDRKKQAPTFCMEVETEGGERFRFLGMAAQEIEIAMEPMRAVTLDLSWIALERQPMTAELTTPTDEQSDAMMAAVDGSTSYSATTWGSDIRNDDALTCFAATLFFTRRDLNPSAFMPDGIPRRFTSAPWRCMAELRVPNSALVMAARTRATGRMGIFFGIDGEDVEFIGNNITAFTDADTIKADDLREETLMVEFHADVTGALIEMRDNSGGA